MPTFPTYISPRKQLCWFLYSWEIKYYLYFHRLKCILGKLSQTRYKSRMYCSEAIFRLSPFSRIIKNLLDFWFLLVIDQSMITEMWDKDCPGVTFTNVSAEWCLRVLITSAMTNPAQHICLTFSLCLVPYPRHPRIFSSYGDAGCPIVSSQHPAYHHHSRKPKHIWIL